MACTPEGFFAVTYDGPKFDLEKMMKNVQKRFDDIRGNEEMADSLSVAPSQTSIYRFEDLIL